MRPTRPGARVRTGMRYRSVPQTRIVAFLRLIGWLHAADVPAAEHAAGQVLAAWVASGLGVRVMPDGERRYDPVEVVNFFKRAGLSGEDGFWSDRWLPTLYRMNDDLRALGDRPRITLEYRRVFPPRPGMTRLRAPLPLIDDFLRDLEIDAALEGPGEVRVVRGRLEARLSRPPPGEMVLRSRCRFVAAAYRPPDAGGRLPPQASALYLRPREGLIVVSDRVAALARSLAAPGTTPRRMIEQFWDYLLDAMFIGGLHYDQVDPEAPCDWALDAGVVDCQLGAALLIALCRAVGVPSRLVAGNFLYRRAPTQHYWAEIWLEETGWTPFDLFSWDLSRGGRDAARRKHFFANLDPRLITQRLPLDFTGAPGVPIPREWHVLQNPTADGVAIEMIDLDGRTIYDDRVSVLQVA